MLSQNDIIDEKNSILKKVSESVIFPLSKEDKDLIDEEINYLRLSQDEEYAEEHNIRGGMGLAFVQLGVLKRIFVICYKRDDDSFEEYTVINPKILTFSEELIYVEEGEGCLSVNRPVEGIVPRHARITVEYYNTLGEKQTSRAREEIAVAFQHEIDHLDGILFTDKIDKSNPYKNNDKYRAI
ncbi:MAG: peptide deformylase [Bacilli bacterium]